MNHIIEKRLTDQMHLTLPSPATPAGSYVPVVRSGFLAFVSGQLPMRDGVLTCGGKVGGDVSLADAAEAARVSALSALAALKAELGSLDAIVRVVKVEVFVNSSPGFTDQAKVANGASEFLGELFGPAGVHTRAAVGVAELPLDAAVEVTLIVEIAH